MKDATQFHIRPARPEEAGLFYAQHPAEDERLGVIGHIRMDFGRSGNEFWHTWWPRGPEELNSPAFKLELQEVVDTLRESVLKSRFAMERFCYEHGGKISGGYVQNYPPARRKLAEHGISCEGHAARPLTNQDYDKYDLLIGMDSANLRNMYRICGGDFAGKLHLLMDYTDHPRDVADPWYTEDFESTWRDVLAGCQGLLKELLQERGEQNGAE